MLSDRLRTVISQKSVWEVIRSWHTKP